MATLNGLAILSSDVVMPLIGPWHARLDVAHDVAVTGLVAIDLDGLALTGTVTRAGLNSGRLQLAVVGGRGGLTTQATAKHYTTPTVRQILTDLTRLSGEVLSSTVDAGLLGRSLPSWHRPEAEVKHCLTLLTDELGANWRILADGALWLGAETWPNDSTEHTLLDERWTDGVFTVAMSPPALRPGVTFRGQRLEQVTHWLASGQLRTEAQLTSPRGLLERFLGPLRRRIQYSCLHPARVAGQNADGTLQVVPDDAELKGSGLDRVPIRSGLPGSRVTVQSGARVRLGFDGGNPSKPFAALWDEGLVGATDLVTEIKLGKGLGAVLREGDTISITPGNGAGVVAGVVTVTLGLGAPPEKSRLKA